MISDCELPKRRRFSCKHCIRVFNSLKSLEIHLRNIKNRATSKSSQEEEQEVRSFYLLIQSINKVKGVNTNVYKIDWLIDWLLDAWIDCTDWLCDCVNTHLTRPTPFNKISLKHSWKEWKCLLFLKLIILVFLIF